MKHEHGGSANKYSVNVKNTGLDITAQQHVPSQHDMWL